MLDPCEGVVVDLPQVFVSARWAPRTTTKDVIHGLTLLAEGTFWIICKSPPVHIFDKMQCLVQTDVIIFKIQGFLVISVLDLHVLKK